jgi:transcriptional regulator with XRE-family HTH domain
MTVKSPNPVDRHVGSRVRMRRMLAGMSQERLGSALGITFQQIQKYEKGTNRIGASRLQQIARVLAVPVSYFFEDAPGGADAAGADGFAETGSNYVSDLLATSDGLQLTKAFLRVRDPRVRRRLVELVTALADASE